MALLIGHVLSSQGITPHLPSTDMLKICHVITVILIFINAALLCFQPLTHKNYSVPLKLTRYKAKSQPLPDISSLSVDKQAFKFVPTRWMKYSTTFWGNMMMAHRGSITNFLTIVTNHVLPIEGHTMEVKYNLKHWLDNLQAKMMLGLAKEKWVSIKKGAENMEEELGLVYK
ncbi:hypothetical protein C8J56DRAFT_1057963 [Mycena floridula]|nr:hypothetical protein C8J56DRAFT_1057963 [Mycena floridula]